MHPPGEVQWVVKSSRRVRNVHAQAFSTDNRVRYPMPFPPDFRRCRTQPHTLQPHTMAYDGSRINHLLVERKVPERLQVMCFPQRLCLDHSRSCFRFKFALNRMYLSTEAIIAIVTLFVMCLPSLFVVFKKLWRSRDKNVLPSSMLGQCLSILIRFRS